MGNWSTCLRNTSRCHVYFPSQIQYRTGRRWSCCSHMGVEKTPAFSAAPVLSSCQDSVHGVVTGHRCPVAPHVPRISLKVCPCPSPADPNQPSRLQPFTPTRIDLLAIKRRRPVARCGGTEALAACWWTCEVAAMWKTVWWLQEIKYRMAWDPATPVPSAQPKRLKSRNLNTHLHDHVHSGVFYNNNRQQQSSPAADKRIAKCALRL